MDGWTKEQLDKISTVEKALEDMSYGWLTSYCGDSGKIILINPHCNCCGEYIEDYRENGLRLANLYCKECRSKYD